MNYDRKAWQAKIERLQTSFTARTAQAAATRKRFSRAQGEAASKRQYREALARCDAPVPDEWKGQQ